MENMVESQVDSPTDEQDTLESDENYSTTGTEANGSKHEKLESTMASAACDYCRSLHLKCDRNLNTCNQCSKREQKCLYSPPKKRGRKSHLEEELKKQQKLVTAL